MELKRELVDEIPVISVVEKVEIDIGNCEEFKTVFSRLLEEGDRQVVLDASNVEFFDSAGMGGLLSLHKRLKQRDGQLVISGLNRSVAEVFRMVGFDVVFATFPDVSTAVNSYKGA
jgi:anti-sigma B factor antagonist